MAFPRHSIDYAWSAEALEGMGDFEAIAVYEVTIESSDDGQSLETVERERIDEISHEDIDGEVSACS